MTLPRHPKGKLMAQLHKAGPDTARVGDGRDCRTGGRAGSSGGVLRTGPAGQRWERSSGERPKAVEPMASHCGVNFYSQ